MKALPIYILVWLPGCVLISVFLNLLPITDSSWRTLIDIVSGIIWGYIIMTHFLSSREHF